MPEPHSKNISRLAEALLIALSDPEEAEKPHVVVVTDPKNSPSFREILGPYPTGVEALAAAERIPQLIPLYRHMKIDVERLLTEAEMSQ